MKNKVVLMSASIADKLCVLKCWFKKNILRNSSNFNEQSQLGNLPVRVLQHNIMLWLEIVSPDFFEEIKREMDNKGLKFKYHDDCKPIYHATKINAASISSVRLVNVYETFNAYLWCICYSLFVTFDEVIQKPNLKGNYTGVIDFDNKHVRAAIKVFNYGMSLKKSYSDWDYSIPNPEKFDCKYAFYVEKTNAIFVAAMFFIMSHEIGHSYYNHVTYIPATAAQSLQEELDADNFAVAQVLTCSDDEILPTLKYGAVAGMCALLFLSPKLYQGGTYPDADNRIRNVMEKLQLNDFDNHWGFASLAFKLWADYFNVGLPLPKSSENYSELFYEILYQMNLSKKP